MVSARGIPVKPEQIARIPCPALKSLRVGQGARRSRTLGRSDGLDGRDDSARSARDRPVGQPCRARSVPLPRGGSESTTAPAGKKATRVLILGSGGPMPDPSRSGPSVAVVSSGRAYLVDFGPGVVRRSVEALDAGWRELGPRKLLTSFVTHLHSDHTAGYADLILTPASVGRTQPLEVYGPPGLAKMTEHILAAYEMDLAERKAGKTARPAVWLPRERARDPAGPRLRGQRRASAGISGRPWAVGSTRMATASTQRIAPS